MASKLAPWAVRSGARTLQGAAVVRQHTSRRAFQVSSVSRSDNLNVVCHQAAHPQKMP